MLTIWSRLATAHTGNGIGQPQVINSQRHPERLKFPLQSHRSLHTGLVLFKNIPMDVDKSKKAIKERKPCSDPCEDDEQMDAIAEHVAGRCPKDPCSKVRDPCVNFIKEHISKKNKTGDEAKATNKLSTAKTKPNA
ncbi:uncharacterized protein LOC116805115 [Drosophila grimshawi]|uniref:uncharacterized protein LOC116805115 n=1 Tax=Drosophila grimshawi TaxID=7222 RepID=UPI0013EF092A|nr:uncharacterized protein LOC116805115 [Drosophila grimshawi]